MTDIEEARKVAQRLRVGDEDWMPINEDAADTIDALIAEVELLKVVDAEPVAWRTFDGEGGYDYRAYEGNEGYQADWNTRNPNHVGWVDALYAKDVKHDTE
ncbi:MAG: hypothetical protein CGW95_06490 [Phenylobacterium zucineum]|nr:MAG: hypothetical protein CGW95_06490 [Phenylobacterium zucineum]